MAAAESKPEPDFLLVNKEELLACSLPEWYEHFEEHTFESVFVPMPITFMEYLLSDGLVLPKECALPCMTRSCDCDSNDSWAEDDSEGLNIDQVSEEPSFPELVQEISEGIRTLHGSVFPKLNWSSPKDAKWVAPGNTLLCTCPGEIILLLKSSQFISHDLTVVIEQEAPVDSKANGSDNIQTGSGCQGVTDRKDNVEFKHTICLRKWTNIRLPCEFRCFVWDHCIIAISQRHCDNYYYHLSQDRDLIIRDLVLFQSRNVAYKFALRNYVLDLYRPANGVVKIVDFNPFCPITDSPLFTWSELKEIIEGNEHEKGPVFRIVSDPVGIVPSSLDTARLPKDVIELSAGTNVHALIDLMKLRQ